MQVAYNIIEVMSAKITNGAPIFECGLRCDQLPSKLFPKTTFMPPRPSRIEEIKLTKNQYRKNFTYMGQLQ